MEDRAVPLASLLGTMGGNLGLFLGMSIMTFLEFFEFFTVVLLSSLCCCVAKKVISKEKKPKPTEVEMVEEISITKEQETVAEVAVDQYSTIHF